MYFVKENSDASKSFSLIPCEFCNEYFTSDILIDHQVIIYKISTIHLLFLKCEI